jgi:hypothetical protein
MCVFIFRCCNDIIHKQNISNNGFENMHATDEIQNLSLLFDMCVNSQFPINRVFEIMTNLKKDSPKK